MTIKNIKLNLSATIYEELTKGRIINRNVYSTKLHTLIDNPLFLELRENLEDYVNQYLMSGHELMDQGEYFYLVYKKHENNSKQLIKTKIYSAIIVLVRCVTHLQSRLFDSLKNVNYGVDISELNDITLPEEYQLILEKAQHPSLVKAVEYLSEKNLLLKTNRNKYILSSSGLALIDEIKLKHSNASS
jgi:hypothetical protein